MENETKNIDQKVMSNIGYEDFCYERCKMILFDFYVDTQKKDLLTIKDVKDFIDAWMKLHFQY